MTPRDEEGAGDPSFYQMMYDQLRVVSERLGGIEARIESKMIELLAGTRQDMHRTMTGIQQRQIEGEHRILRIEQHLDEDTKLRAMRQRETDEQAHQQMNEIRMIRRHQWARTAGEVVLVIALIALVAYLAGGR